MIYILLVWLLFITGEVLWNDYLWKKNSVNHRFQTVVRVSFGLLFWLFTPIFNKHIQIDQWWAEPLMMMFTFWFLFDIGLNLKHKQDWWYIGGTSKLDKLQRQWPLPWWFFKLMLALMGTTLFFYGFNKVLYP